MWPSIPQNNFARFFLRARLTQATRVGWGRWCTSWGCSPQIDLPICCLIACNTCMAWNPMNMDPALGKCREAMGREGQSLVASWNSRRVI